MSSREAIVLKNIRRDIPALKPLAANVILLQRQLIEAVQRYQEYNLRPDRDEAQLQEMLHEISIINKSQREELERVREAEMSYVSLDDNNSFSSDSISGEPLDDCEENGHFKSSDSDASSNSIVCSDGEDTLDHRLLPSSHETIPQEEPRPDEITPEEAIVIVAPAETVMEVVEEEEEPMDWYDLNRENWSEADKLLQKIERTGSKILQQDFMSSIELVHVNQYKSAEEALARRKAKITQGKKVLTTGPWQIIDIPTKVSNRRCNYLTGLHITVRQKDPKRSSAATTSLECFNERVKTRHHESRGSSRTSSRASSPISSQADSYQNGYHRPHHNSNGNTKLLRSTKSRATAKIKRPSTASQSQSSSSTNNKASNNQTKTSSSTAARAVTTTTTTVAAEEVKESVPLPEPCVTYTMVDGVPHFQVYFPPSKESKEQQETTCNAATNTTPQTTKQTTHNKSNSPRASIVESDIESHRTNGHSSSSSKVKPSSGKAAKRPRIIQSTASSSSVIKAAGSPSGPTTTGVTLTTTTSSNNSPSPSSSMTPPTSAGKEDLGMCIEKCGTWMGSPHFKTHRTLPSVNSTVASSVTGYWSPSPSVTTTIKPVTSTPVPKLTSPVTTAKMASPNNAKLPPPMPKLTIGNNQALKQQQFTAPPPIIQLQTNGGKFVPIAPKMMSNSVMAVPNIVIVPFADKNSQSALSNNNQPSLSKRSNAPISLLKTTYPQLSISTASSSSSSSSPSGGYLTVKTLKETQQQQQHYKQEVQSSSTNQQRMQHDDNHVEIKRKVVKLFPSGNSGNGHKDQEDATQQHLAPPTVIVADMSM